MSIERQQKLDRILRGETLTPEWRETIKEGLQSALDNFELFDSLVNVSPQTLSQGLDDRNFPDLLPEEQEFIQIVLFERLGAVPASADLVDRYRRHAAPGASWAGKAVVRVYKTQRSDEGMFLHEIFFENDSKIDYVVAPKDYRFEPQR